MMVMKVRDVIYAIRRGTRESQTHYSAYVPDLPGCVATGTTVQEAMSAIRKAIEFHIEGLVEDGDPIPDSGTLVDYVEVHIAATAP
jgi:predicted RNase H-like HicB family nuclease